MMKYFKRTRQRLIGLTASGWAVYSAPPRIAVFLTVIGFALALAPGAFAAATVTYYYTSPQGTVLAKADAAGNVTGNADYRPYGSQALGAPEVGPGYWGHVNDPDSGLVYMQARYYEPIIGRFMSVDPESLKAGDFSSYGRFTYANNNPISNIDPDGRQNVPLEAYSRYSSVSSATLAAALPEGNAAYLIYAATGSDVLNVAPAGSGSGAVESTGFPGEFILAGGAARGAGMLASASREVPQVAAQGLAALPRMRVADITAKGAAQANYVVNWSQKQFEGHLQSNGFTAVQRGPVSVWSTSDGTKAFSTRAFSRSGGPTGEMFKSDKLVAKFRFDQNYSP